MNLAIVLGLCASVAVIVLSLSMQRSTVVIMSAVISVFTISQYAVLGQWTAVVLAGVTLLYALCVPLEQRFSWLGTAWTPIVLAVAYTAVFGVMNGLSWSADILAYLASVTGTILMSIKNPVIIKLLMLGNGLTWGGYQVMTGAYGQLPGEAVFLAGVVVSLFLLGAAARRGQSIYHVPEIPVLVRRALVNA